MKNILRCEPLEREVLVKFVAILSFFFILACTQQEVGFLQVDALQDGEYEVFKILGEATPQFISVQMGSLNKKLPLHPGS